MSNSAEFIIKKQDINYQIYLNIQHFAAFRGLKIEGDYPLTEERFNTERTNKGYIITLAGNTTFVQIPQGSEYHKKDKLRRILVNIGTDKLIIIKYSKVNIKNVAFEGYCEIIDGDISLIKDNSQSFRDKATEIRLITEEERQILEEYFLVSGENIAPIDSSSQEVIWYGFQSGDIVKIKCPSLASNSVHSSYRRIN